MQTRSRALLRVLLNRYHQKGKEAIVRALPDEEAKAILSEDIPSDNPKLLLAPYESVISRIHYSWLHPAILHIPKSLRKPLFSALSEEKKNKLKQWFPEASEASHNVLSPPVKAYLLQILYKNIEHSDILPIAYLPQTPLTPLASWSKPQIVELIAFLGIHDLAPEVRQIISNEKLLKLTPCLNPKQKQYLRICLHQQERLVTPPLDLDKWNGDIKTLTTKLHRRGILRLGKALSGQHEDLFWHIAHTLDTGRGRALLQYYSHMAIPGITSVLVQQVGNLMTFLQTKGVE